MSRGGRSCSFGFSSRALRLHTHYPDPASPPPRLKPCLLLGPTQARGHSSPRVGKGLFISLNPSSQPVAIPNAGCKPSRRVKKGTTRDPWSLVIHAYSSRPVVGHSSGFTGSQRRPFTPPLPFADSGLGTPGHLWGAICRCGNEGEAAYACS